MKESLIKVNSELSSDLISFMASTEESEVSPFMNLWEEQEKYVSASTK